MCWHSTAEVVEVDVWLQNGRIRWDGEMGAGRGVVSTDLSYLRGRMGQLMELGI